MQLCSAEFCGCMETSEEGFWSASLSGSLMPLFKKNNLQHNYTTLDCLLAESSNKERLDCKVIWHMTCIFQRSAVETGLEDTHTGIVSGRQHTWWIQTTREGHFLNLQAFQRDVRNPHGVVLQGMLHDTYWSKARHRACCRKARRQLFCT